MSSIKATAPGDLELHDQSNKDFGVGETVEISSTDDSRHVFSDPSVAAYWWSVYEDAKYECRHRFDPHMTWSTQREDSLRRKVITPTDHGGLS